MHIQHRDFATSPALRAALKRGLARQALGQAGREGADLPAIFAALCDVAPNRKALERAVLRLGAAVGVVKVALSAKGGGLALTLRNLREVVLRVEGQEVFRETALIYTRAVTRPGCGLHLSRASFCAHAIERLIERSNLPLDAPVLTVLDTEATALLRGLWQNRDFTDQDDAFIAARQAGVWAGGQDEMPLEEDWGLSYSRDDMRVPLFSVRTFLSPDEMRPTVWAKWAGDPALTGRG